MTLKDFAEQRLDELDQRVQRELTRAAAGPDPDAIHDLRVSMRRHTQALRAMKSILLKGEVKIKRGQLRETMNFTAEVRNRDIALELLAAAGVEEESPLARRLKRQRTSASKALLRHIKAQR